jgi:hypothetical protein
MKATVAGYGNVVSRALALRVAGLAAPSLVVKNHLISSRRAGAFG